MNEGGNILKKLWWPPQRVSKLTSRALGLRHETLLVTPSRRLRVNNSCIEIPEITINYKSFCFLRGALVKNLYLFIT